MWTKIILFVFTKFVTAKNIRKVLEVLIGLAEKHVKSTKNDLDNKIIVALKEAMGL